MTKESLQALIDKLPEDFNLFTLIEELKIIQKNETRELQSVEMRAKNHEEVLDYWSKKFKEKGF
jgi:hypothetical protein